VYLHGVGDPGNVGTIVRARMHSATGPSCWGRAAPTLFPESGEGEYGIYARASSGSGEPGRADRIKAGAGRPGGCAVGRGRGRAAGRDLRWGGARGPAAELSATVDASARIRMRPDGPDSLNVAMAATVALLSSDVGCPAMADARPGSSGFEARPRTRSPRPRTPLRSKSSGFATWGARPS
jgi:hypothetical protein